MKYYIYISDTKVDMLFAQIPRKTLEGLAGELNINFGIFSTTLKQDAAEENRFSKLEVVRKYIEKHSVVGTIDSPSEYFAGEETMKWGSL
jgi:hypothetical protein